MIRRLALNSLALLLGVIASLALLEVALRIYNPILATVKGQSLVLPANYDEVRRYPDVPGLQALVHIHQNSLGFRGADPPADLADRLSIVTIGGSTTHSVSQNDDRTWTAVLGTLVTNCFDRIWINNAGFDGHTSFAHIQLIRKYIIPLHPKVAVLLIGANEPFSSGSQVLDRLPDFGIGLRDHLADVLYNSAVVGLALTLYRSWRAWWVGLNIRFDWHGERMPDDVEANLAQQRRQQIGYAARLRRIIELLHDGRTVPVLLTQPSFGRAGQDPVTGKDWTQQKYLSRVYEIYNATMRQVAQDEHVKVIDLARMMPQDSKYYLDIIHYNDAGSQEFARLVATDLVPYLQNNFHGFDNGSCKSVSTNPE